jgi:hypothetical protein
MRLSPALMIAHGHAFSTVATNDEADVKSAGPSRGGDKRSGAYVYATLESEYPPQNR